VVCCCSMGWGGLGDSVLGGGDALVAGARRWRKVTGGGMRQAGLLAAAGLYALDHNVERLAEDHARAACLAKALATLPDVANVEQHTNMVFVDVPPATLPRLREPAETHRVRLSIGDTPRLRLALHLDVPDDALVRVVAVFSREPRQ